MPGWLLSLLPLIQEAPTVLEGLLKLFQGAHNEMTAGSGSTQPTAVTAALMEHADAIHAAVVANTAGAVSETDSDPETATAE